MMYPTAEETRGYIIILLQQKHLSVPELCVNLFDRTLKGLEKECGVPLKVSWEQLKLAEWLNENYPAEWIMTCQGCDELLEDNVVVFNTQGLLQLTDDFNRLGKKG